MEASKCPKCGDEPHFVDQLEKWYCYGCNSYLEDEEHHVGEEHTTVQPEEPKASEIAKELKSIDEDDLPTCRVCGATLEKVQGGKLFCFVCECAPESPVVPALVQPKPTVAHNEAQAILDSITVAAPVAPGLKPNLPPLPEVKKAPPIPIKMCATCGQPLKFIEKYQRDYCYGCRKYAPREIATKQPETPKPAATVVKNCPDCGGELKYIEKYTEYYCHACKKYPLRVQKRSHGLKCPKCGEPLRLIEKYHRHYCIACKEYAPKGYGEGPSDEKACPICHGQMRWVPEYNEWYCYKCKKYSLRPSKPALLI